MPAVALATVLATMACTANPPASNLRGLVAYSTEDGAIWVMHADGSNRRQVTTTRHPAYDFDPSLSPDGRRVVFRTSRGRYAPDPNGTGVQGIFVIDVDGSHEHQIQPPRGGLFPDWSPDGRRIAFSTLRANGTETIVTTDPDGSHRRQLTRSPGRDYPGVWSPDGRQLAFGSQRHGSFDVYVMDADGSDQRRLTDTGDEQSPVAWLPDGQIVFSQLPRRPATARLVPDEPRRDRDPLPAPAAGGRRPDRLAGSRSMRRFW